MKTKATAARRARALGASGTLLAALLLASPAQALSRTIRFERLSTDHGLSQSSVMSLLQDSQGFMWFGTEAGLNRYDGRTFTVYRHDVHDPVSIPSDFVWDVAEDANGDLWVATEGGGLARWERATDRFVHYPVDPKGSSGTPSRQLRTVHVDSKGSVWAGTKDAGLVRLDPRSGHWQSFRSDPGDPESLADDGVYAIHEGPAGTLWVGTNRGLSRFEPATGRFLSYYHEPNNPRSLGADRIRGIHEDREGRLWVATFGGGLDVLAKGGERFEHIRHDAANPRGLADDFVHAVREDSAGRLWVATRSGLQLREADGSFSTYRNDAADPRSLGDSDVLSLFEGRSGVLWFGTRAGGAARFDPRTWAFGLVRPEPGHPGGLANGYVTSFSEDAHGNLWIGTLGGLHELTRASGEMRRYASGQRGLKDDRVMALLHDKRGRLLVGTMEGGLNRYDPSRGRFEVFRSDAGRPGSLSANGVMALLEDRRGSIWVGTYGGGLNRLDVDANRFTTFRHDPKDPTSVSRDVVTALAEDPSGALWLGTEGGGLNRLDPGAARFERFTHDPADAGSLADDTVYALHVDASGRLWAGTRSGLSRLDPGSGPVRFRSYTSGDGLAGNVVYGIQSDGVGRLWLSGSQGLVRFDPRTGTFKQYTASQGLQGNEFNFGAHYRSPQGELLFGGPAGFNAFFPERLPANGVPPEIALVSFRKFNQPARDLGPAYALRSFDLGYRDSVVSFEFAALHFAAPDRNRFAYKLEGFDGDWIDLGNQGRVTLTNLDAGSYTLRVRAANADGTWNEEGLALPLRVAPAPWRSPWAYGLYLLTTLSVAGVGVRAHRRRAAREAEYRRRLELEVQQRTQELCQRNDELETVNTRLAETSLTDSLTGLRNRRYLFEQVSKEVRAIQRQHVAVRSGLSQDAQQLMFIMVDLDWFKPINDSCGHAAGDRLLLQVKAILERACRASDVLIRWGGDEFLVVGRTSDLENFEVLPERIRAMIEQTTFELGDGQLAHVTCSIGFTAYPAELGELENLSLEQVVALADQALYSAKRGGRNGWVGLLTTPETDVRQLLRAVQSDPEALLSANLEVRRSTTQRSTTRSVLSQEAAHVA
jgi:diguanylate cyclase (GGDEF)-like protein